MTTLAIPSLERRLLRTVTDEMAAKPVSEWPQRSLRVCLDVLRKIRESAAETRREVEQELSVGAEAGAFVRHYNPCLAAASEHLEMVHQLAEVLAPATDPASQSLAAELGLLEQENRTYCELLAKALFLASKPPGPVDWERLKEESDADFAAGRFTSFATPEEMVKGLGSD
jgi:hypothetical protein